MEAYSTDNNGGHWHGPLNLGMGPLSSQPSAPPTWYGGEEGIPADAVAWDNLRGQLVYADSTNPTSKRSWHGPFTRKNIVMVSPPSVADAGGGTLIVFYEGTNDHIEIASLLAGSLTFGPCDMGFGSIGSHVSALWERIPPITGVTATGGLTAPRVKPKPPNFKGNCPHAAAEKDWYGQQGEYVICWAGLKIGLTCMGWMLVASLFEGDVVVFTPATYRPSAGSLSSAPSLAAWPSNTVPASSQDLFVYWQGPPLKLDLIQINVNTDSRPKDLGYGPLTPR